MSFQVSEGTQWGTPGRAQIPGLRTARRLLKWGQLRMEGAGRMGRVERKGFAQALGARRHLRKAGTDARSLKQPRRRG